jgi:ATP-dependent HslUV protease subunit HslV
MTTIAYRDGVMAADSGVWLGDAVVPWARKLIRGPDGALFGFSGNAGHATTFFEWVDGGYKGDRPKPEPEPDGRSSLLVLHVPKDGPVRLISAYGTEVYDAPYFSIGAGNVGALCAMHAGAGAEAAIEAAIVHAPGAQAPVRSIRHD